jgi:hypothetical protein
MTVLGHYTLRAQTETLAPLQDAPWAALVLARVASLKASVADFWPVTVIALALGLTLAWTGVLMSLLWWGIEELI